MRTVFQFSKVALFVHAVSLPLMASADTSADNFSGETLNEIVVSGTPFSQKMGTQKITEEQIKNRPTTNGNITELLKANPNVQFSNRSGSGQAGGEIAPDEVSFHGEKFYNNNFTIDGFSNNDNINPGANNGLLSADTPDGYSPTDLPAGGSQSLWLDTSLLKSVEVFDSNISAKYGKFTGGVIDAQLKDPDLERASGKVFYRTTRSSWADFFYLDEDDKSNIESATRLSYQPQFKKHQYGMVLNQPLGEHAGLLFSYNRSTSKIPYYHSNLQKWTNQERINETYLLRGLYSPTHHDVIKATVIYSPHESKYYKKNVENGAFTNTGGGVQVNLQWDHDFDWGSMKSYVGYKKTGNKIEHESTSMYNYPVSTASTTYHTVDGQEINWKTNTNQAQYGGYGTFSTEKTTFSFKQDYELKPFDLGTTEHRLGFGWDIEMAKAKYKRNSDVYYYSVNTRSATTASDCTECVAGEYYFTRRTYYPARNVSATDNSYSAYIQDSIRWKRLEVTPGIRFDYDEYLGNTNIAPRLSASYDVFGDQSTQLFAGVSRYYANTMLAYKLRKSISLNAAQRRTSETGSWTGDPSVSGIDYDISDLKTPHSDEYVLGLSQKFLDANWTLKWVNRHSKDTFSRQSVTKDGQRYYQLTNNGSSKSDTITLSVEPLETYKFKYAHIGWALGANISHTKTKGTYYDVANADETYEKSILDDKLIDTAELPAFDFNSPWRAFFNLNTYFPRLRLNWDQVFSYQAGYNSYTRSTVSCASYADICGSYQGNAYKYNKIKYGNTFLVDWRFTYKQPIVKDQYVEVTLDINNVLNRKVVGGSATGSNGVSSSENISYKMGRNFWLGVSYNW